MKKQLTMLVACALCYNSFGQSLIFKGATPSVQKGDINTEVLTAVIQQKQKEIKQRVFKNSVIRVFKKNDYTTDFNNFASYHYLYNVMDAMVTNTNKTAITKAIIENSSEFAVVFAATLYVKDRLISQNKDYGTFSNKSIYKKEGDKNSTFLTISANTFEDAESEIKLAGTGTAKSGKSHGNRFDFDEDAMKKINLLMDLCYDVIIKDPAWQDVIKFKDDPYNDNELGVWYNSEFGNVFLYECKEAAKNDAKYLAALNQMRTDVEGLIAEIKPTAIKASTARKEIKTLLTGLEKSKYKDFSMTKEQFESMKFVIDEFLKIAKNKFSNDLVVAIVDNLLENTVMEFVNENGVPVKADDANAKSGFLAINIESVITILDGKFSVDNKHSIATYIRPMFTIGVNYLRFPNSNTLNSNENTVTPTTTVNSLPTVTIATEKIGVEWILFNWKYKRCHKAGDLFYYYGRQCVYEEPVKQPLFSNFFVNAYAGGLLYNIVNTTTNNNFNYMIIGGSAGFTFYNGLKLSVGVGNVLEPKEKELFSDNMYYNVGVDVPIFDYIAALKNKKD